jgi:hypothetical protein
VPATAAALAALTVSGSRGSCGRRSGSSKRSRSGRSSKCVA